MSKQLKWKDIAERTFWTAAEAGVAYLGAKLVDAPQEWIIPVASALAVLKGWIATKIGNKDSASLTANI